MGRIVVTEFVSLDGVMEEPRWTFDFERGEAGDRFKYEELFDASALLLGRTTYDGFAAAWPSMGHDDFGQRMNAIPKYVVSSTLSDEAAQWGPTTVLRGKLEEDVTRLRDEFDGTLLVEGSAALVHDLAAADLVDAYRLMVFPVVLGSGLRVFPNAPTEAQRFDLVESAIAGTGIVLLRYERVR
jgi:dihydrofolate reductase